MPDFQLERYFAKYEFQTPHLLCCSDCESFTISEILALEPGSQDKLLSLKLGYTESLGAAVLRDQISSLYSNLRADQVLVHSGAEEAIFNFMHACLAPGDHVIVHVPAYQSLFEVARAAGCEVSMWTAREEQGWALDLDELRKLIRPQTRVVVINCPNNPTGYIMDPDSFSSFAQLAEERDIVVFSDEVYRLAEYAENSRLPAMCDLSPRAVSLGVMSKSFGLPGLRIGWIATRNEAVFERMAAFKDYTTICNSAPAELIATVALKHKEHLLDRNRRIMLSNLATLGNFVGLDSTVFSWKPGHGGPIGFPALRDNSDAATFCNRVREQSGVLLLPGTVYGENYRSNFRIGFGRRNFLEGLAKLRHAASHLRQQPV